MQYVYVGRNELVALIVGLVTGTLYSWLDLPIPAPNVLGGIFAIIFTYLGYLIVNVAPLGHLRTPAGRRLARRRFGACFVRRLPWSKSRWAPPNCKPRPWDW
ncbi:XapX domain-containing protein [Pandoraea pnomenusa]|uniref:XapX domain-containing protein n=1 Tax=Pandoraea pnomenusa TaxID=93220 RepID=UPI003C6DD0EA